MNAIPPQADAGWIGEEGPGPSYLDPGSGGPENDFTKPRVGRRGQVRLPQSRVRLSRDSRGRV
jgi:hypothetical protein